MGESIFKHDGILGGIFTGFICGISIESHWNYQGIQM